MTVSNEHLDNDTLIAQFAAEYPFTLDPFQLEAIQHLLANRSVLVAAPTGTGKTLVAEFAIWMARRRNQRVIYTAPLKALSNQKFRDLRIRYGEDSVGLLTGDIVEQGHAPIVVMTTEIYRNMLLELGLGPETVAEVTRRRRQRMDYRITGQYTPDIGELAEVGVVIFDELHYLSDPERGPVWEEAIICSPRSIQIVGLSATVSNASELATWISRVHRPISLVWHEERAVPLEHYFYYQGELHLVQDATGKRVKHFPHVGGEARAILWRRRSYRYGFDEEDDAAEQQWADAPEPGEILRVLRKAELLPCLYFLPGRRAAEEAALSAVGHLLVSPAEREQIAEEVRAWLATLAPEDRTLDQVQQLTRLLSRGLAYHHAGLVPGLKVLVETLFARGLLRAVFATDTLALGINVPARSVVLGSLSKFDGVSMRMLTPNEYQQLTGRAGRRGMDERGAAIIPYSPWYEFEPAFQALTGPLLPVTSAFTIRYNSILNLWQPHNFQRLRAVCAASLREFQRSAALRERAAQHGKAPRRIAALSRSGAAELKGTVAVLRAFGYIGPNDELTLKGHLLRGIFHPAGLILTELLLSSTVDTLSPGELAEFMSWFVFDDDRPLRNRNHLHVRLVEARRDVYRVQQQVQAVEMSYHLALSPGIVEKFHGVALNWWRGMTLRGLMQRISLAEGDLLVTLNQTVDLLQQVQSAISAVLAMPGLWNTEGLSARQASWLSTQRTRLERLQPALGAASRNLVRGIVLQSRSAPTIAIPGEGPIPAPMAEDEEDVRESRLDAIEIERE
jgi:ATP-dependent RNA helicase HelY